MEDTMLKPGTKVRTLSQHSETGRIVRKTKAERAGDVRYFGSEEKAAAWHLVKFDIDGAMLMIHRDGLAIAND
jgi:hypothetical protein